MAYDDAVDALYQAPLDVFVAQRKQLAAALKAAGDKEGAARLAKRARPPASAWVVNQLWWQARPAFEAMFASAARLRAGALDGTATAAHREAIAALRAGAATRLAEAGHGATEAVLRRVTTTLAALAVDGGFGAERAGTLAEDRESPGFAAAGVTVLSDRPAAAAVSPPTKTEHVAAEADARVTPEPAHQVGRVDGAAQRRAEQEAAEVARAAAAAERHAREQEAARRAAERHRLETELRAARGDATLADKDVAHLEGELVEARGVADLARALVEDLTAKLAALAHH